MRTVQYRHVDVFTEKLFGGNQLAVFVDGSSLNTEEMQKLAHEMNFAETTFLLPPETAGADKKARIFTPRKELGFSGHPVLGSAYVVAHEGMVELQEPRTILNLELGMGAGVVQLELEVTNQTIGFVNMLRPKPTFERRGIKQLEKIAEALAIDAIEIEATGFPVEAVSCGSPILFVPINSLHVMETMQPNKTLLEALCQETETNGVFVLSKETVHPNSTLHTRVFLPHEESATGFTSPPLGIYLIHNEVVPPNPTVKIISEQGYEINRPSTVHTEVGMEGTNIETIRIGGHVVPVAKGNLTLK